MAARASQVVNGLMSLMTRLGLRTTLAKRMVPTLPDRIGPDDQRVMLRELHASGWQAAITHEARQMVRRAREMDALQRQGLPHVPTVSLLGSQSPRGGERQRQLVNDATVREMALRTDSTAVVVQDAGHLIPQEQPAAVADEILNLVRRIRQPTNSQPY
jgi:pimeloyl-ACP methyl ester carboxylesterase